MNYPKLRDPVFYFLVAAICALAAIYESRVPEWLKMFLMTAAVVFGMAGVFTAADWVVYRFGARMYEINDAKYQHLTALANSMRGLNTMQTDILRRHQAFPEFIGVVGAGQTNWSVRGLKYDIPLGFIHDVLEASQECSDDHLWPVREYQRFDDWDNARELLTDFTNCMVHTWNYADKASGRYSAQLRKSVAETALVFDLEL